jgi:hypothetical protein
MPTPAFFLYLLVLAAAKILQLSYLGWFGPYFFTCVIAVPVFSVLFSLPAMIMLKTKSLLPAIIGKDMQLHDIQTFLLPSFLPPCRVVVTVEIENRYTGQKTRSKMSSVDPRRENLAFEVPTARCGQLRCRVIRLDCTDLIGLIRIRHKVSEETICTVLPMPFGPDSTPDLDAAAETPPIMKPKYGGGYSEEHELREYRPGDSVNAIHWKLSSKMDELIIREPMERENDLIYLVLSRIGEDDRGLEVLYWLSCQLLNRELPHCIVADRIYRVENKAESEDAFCSMLTAPLGEPVRFDASMARCVFLVEEGEVRLC